MVSKEDRIYDLGNGVSLRKAVTTEVTLPSLEEGARWNHDSVVVARQTLSDWHIVSELK